jgi:uncharacterized membrane protein
MPANQKRSATTGGWMIGGFIIGMLIGVVLFPDKLALGAGIGMCLGIFMAALTQIINNKSNTKSES